jgi:Flp pilus assembly protein TadD
MKFSEEEGFRGWFWAACFVLVLLVWLVFGQTLGHGFINCDDDIFVYQNPLVLRGICADTVFRALTGIHDTFYYPLTVLSFMADAKMYGMQAAGFHFTNVLLHTFSVLLLFLFLVRLTGSFGKSFLVSALFAIHPLQVETVVWVTARKDVLSGLFFMLTLNSYLHYVRRPFSLTRYSLVFFLFLGGLMAKVMLVTVPAVLLLLDWWPLKRFESCRRRVWREKIPFFILSAVFSVIPFLAGSSYGSETPVVQPSVLWRLGNAAVSYATYIRQIFLPVGLGMPYPRYELNGVMLSVSAAVFLMISGGVIYFRKKSPVLLFGWLWYLGMLFPVSGAMRFLGVARADRFVYLPGIGLFILIVWAAARMPVSKKYGKAGVCAVLAVAGIAAHFQVRYWRNNLTLWTRALEVTGPSAIAYINLGAALCEANEPDSAEVCFQRTLQLDPNDQEALYNLGLLRVLSNRMIEGEIYLKRVLALNPDRFDANKALGAAYIMRGRLEEGIEYTQKALQVRPEDADIWKNLRTAEELLAEKQKADR